MVVLLAVEAVLACIGAVTVSMVMLSYWSEGRI